MKQRAESPDTVPFFSNGLKNILIFFERFKLIADKLLIRI